MPGSAGKAMALVRLLWIRRGGYGRCCTVSLRKLQQEQALHASFWGFRRLKELRRYVTASKSTANSAQQARTGGGRCSEWVRRRK
jgi:hypothetical protein